MTGHLKVDEVNFVVDAGDICTCERSLTAAC